MGLKSFRRLAWGLCLLGAALATAPLCAAAAERGGGRAEPAVREPAPAPRADVLGAFERGDFRRVVDLCSNQLVADLPPQSRAFYLYYLAAAHQRLANPARALALWSQLREEASDSHFAARALLGIGLAHASLGEWDACARACSHYLDIGEGHGRAVAAYWVAESRARQGDWEEAVAGFRHAVAVAEDHSYGIEARYGLIDALIHRDQIDAALNVLREVEALAPSHAEYARSWLRLAQAARNTGRAALALRAAETALDAEPDLVLPAALVQAECALLGGRPVEAQQRLERLLAEPGSDRQRRRLLADLGWAAYSTRQFVRAIALYEQAQAFGSPALDPRDQLRLALSHFYSGDSLAAAEILGALQGEPALGGLADVGNAVLVTVSLSRDDLFGARALLRAGLAEWPASPRTGWRHELLARIALRLRQWRSAAEGYRAAARSASAPEHAALLRWAAAWAEASGGRWTAASEEIATLPIEALPVADRGLIPALSADAAGNARRWKEAARAYRTAAAYAAAAGETDRYRVRAARAAAVAGDLDLLRSLVGEGSPKAAASEVWLLLGEVAATRGDTPRAIEAWETAAEFQTMPGVLARLRLAWTSLDERRPYDVVRYLSTAPPPTLAPWFDYGRAVAHQQQGTHRVAAAEFFTLAERFPDHPVAVDSALRVGAAFTAAGAWREAETAYTAVAQQTQSRAVRRVALLGIAWTLAERGFDHDAKRAFADALALRDDDEDAIQAWLWLGKAAYQAGDFAEATAAWSRVVALDPPPPVLALAEYWTGRSLMRQGQYVAAAATFASCRGREPARPYAPLVGYWEIRCAQALGDHAAVLANVRALRASYPITAEWVELDMVRAQAHQARGEWRPALAAYDTVAARDTGRLGAEAIIAGAACLEALGDPDGAAVRLFRVRPGERPDDLVARARLELAHVLTRAGRRPDAVQILQDLMRQYPDTDAARAARQDVQEFEDTSS